MRRLDARSRLPWQFMEDGLSRPQRSPCVPAALARTRAGFDAPSPTAQASALHPRHETCRRTLALLG